MNQKRESKIRKARSLRSNGHTYSEIAKHSAILTPKPTVAYWCRNLHLSAVSKKKLEIRQAFKLAKAREKSGDVLRQKKLERKMRALEKAESIEKVLSDLSVKRAILGALYLAEGTKGDRGGPTFGNSDPKIIKLFLTLLRECFKLDESKFRCTVQARASQDIPTLEEFWSHTTKIPPSQFYAARIDPRSNGKPTTKQEYKGVCRIDYFSTDLLYEILALGTMLTKGL